MFVMSETPTERLADRNRDMSNTTTTTPADVNTTDATTADTVTVDTDARTALTTVDAYAATTPAASDVVGHYIAGVVAA
jgi:hypothetical protein